MLTIVRAIPMSEVWECTKDDGIGREDLEVRVPFLSVCLSLFLSPRSVKY